MNDRRKPLGGVDKNTFISSASNTKHNAELTYIMLSGIQSEFCHKLDHVVESVDAIKQQCDCREKNCEERYQKQFVKRVSPKYNVSLQEVFILAFLMGLGVLNIVPMILKL